MPFLTSLQTFYPWTSGLAHNLDLLPPLANSPAADHTASDDLWLQPTLSSNLDNAPKALRFLLPIRPNKQPETDSLPVMSHNQTNS